MKNKIIIHDIGYLDVIRTKKEIEELIRGTEDKITDYNNAIDLIIDLNKINIKNRELLFTLNAELNDKPMLFNNYPECYSRLREMYASIALLCGIEDMKYFDNLTSTVKTYILNKFLQAYNVEEFRILKDNYVNNICLYINRYFKNSLTLNSYLEPMTIFNTSIEFITFYSIMKHIYEENDIIRVLRVIYNNIVKESKQLETTFYLSIDSKYIDISTNTLRYYMYFLFNGKR